MRTSKINTIGIVLILLACVIFGVIWYQNYRLQQVPIVFSAKSMMDYLWQNYKAEYIEPESNRTLDKQQNNITTSEGQSYTMFRAVIMGDQETFDASYKWTKDILKRKEDNLFSWLFGEKPDGTYGVLTERGGYNSASDADTDIALALIFAFNRWHQHEYLDDAMAIIEDIWDKEVMVIDGLPYMTANNVEKFTPDDIIINPSYFAPYAYKIFAKLDPDHDWLGVVDSSYKVLNESTTVLPPDWLIIDKETGKTSPTNIENLTTNYSYDALRVPWRIALDYEWNKEPRAKAYLDKLSFLGEEWRKKKKIASTYSHDGKVLEDNEVPVMYGGAIGYFMFSNPSMAEDVYNKKLKYLFSPDKNAWKNTLSYYDDNWAWFGIGLYNHLIPNI
jgi:endoglucanase